jgi:acetyl-CoA acetyltransferase
MSRDVVILGAGMHPWGKWGRNFVEYGVHAARAALKDAGVSWQDIQFVAGGATMRNGYPGYVAGATFSQALGWQGNEIMTCYAACATGSQALAAARAKIQAGQCEVALVVGADTTPKGFLAPQKGERPDDPDWVRFRLGITNPTYFSLYAQRRKDVYGATDEDFAVIKVKNAEHGFSNEFARYRKKFTVEEVLASPMVASPLRLFEICATSDGGAAVVIASKEYADRLGSQRQVKIGGISTVSPKFASADVEMPDIATDSAAASNAYSFRASIAQKAYEEAGVGPEDVSLAEVYDLSSAMELDWYEYIGLCAQGDAEKLLRDGDTRIGGRVPVNASGGLACFGEAVPAQALAQVCELTMQLRGEAGDRQVENANVGVTGNQGLFGHGSSVVLLR